MKMIGISGNRKFLDGFNRDYVFDHYAACIEKIGAAPVILPITTDKKVAEAYVERIDALIMTGGVDVNPFLYGEEIAPETEVPFTDRDTFDILLIEAALNKDIPILGICRGMQILNVYLGGSLYQDLRYYGDTKIQHVQRASHHEPVHYVEIVKDSTLHTLIGDRRKVNSVHHQAVRTLGKGLVASATSPSDGIIEAYEAADGRRILGIQWHPEMMFASGNMEMENIFRFLLD